MKMKIIYMMVLPALLVSIFSSSSIAAWWLVKESDVVQRIAISDDKLQFKINDINCIVSETQFTRMPDDTIVETRELGCHVCDNTYVSVIASCNLPLYHYTSFSIKKSKKMYNPRLLCGPKKKI